MTAFTTALERNTTGLNWSLRCYLEQQQEKEVRLGKCQTKLQDKNNAGRRLLQSGNKPVYLGPYCAGPGWGAAIFMNLLVGQYDTVALSGAAA